MPTHKQIKVEPPVRTFNMGSSDTGDLKILYSGSPVNDGTLSDAITETIFEVMNQAPILNDGGHTFGTVERDYQGSPNLEEVVVGGGGLPGSPYAPNIAVAPTEPHNPRNIPAAGAEITQKRQGGGGAFLGDGLLSPNRTSEKIGKRRIGDLIFGKSTSE